MSSSSASNQKELNKLSDGLVNFSKNIHFAGVIAITKTVQQCRDAVKKALEVRFTLRNSWSQRSVTITTAKVSDRIPFGEVYVRDQYLREQELGEVRHLKGTEAIPIQIFAAAGIDSKKVVPQKLRASTMISAKKAIVAGNKPFIAASRKSGKRFIFIRDGAGRLPILPLYKIDEEKKEYKIEPKLFFFDNVKSTFDKNLEPNYDAAFERYVLKVKE